MKTYLVDSNVFIGTLKGDKKSQNFIIKHKSRIRLSYIVYFEVIVGARNKREYKAIKDFLCEFKMDLGRTEISSKAVELVDNQLLKDGVKLFDALIVATAITNNYVLVTKDTAHMTGFDEVKYKVI